MSGWATFDLALAEALRLYRVTGEKFPEPFRYTIRKRRTFRQPHGRRVWNSGRHDRWLVLTGPDIPDRAGSNPKVVVPSTATVDLSVVDMLIEHDVPQPGGYGRGVMDTLLHLGLVSKTRGEVVDR